MNILWKTQTSLSGYNFFRGKRSYKALGITLDSQESHLSRNQLKNLKSNAKTTTKAVLPDLFGSNPLGFQSKTERKKIEKLTI